uniref:acyltransferase family protein n=1 Tax=Candidatus Stercorousia sp. TaxID=3048886 RepID=UPI004029A432
MTNNLQNNNFASPQKQHYLWADITKGIAIILVIMGHSFASTGNICKFIFLFHMPLFFLISGYFFNFSKYYNNLKALIKTSAKRLLLPALLSLLFCFNFNYGNLFKHLISIAYAIGKDIPDLKIVSIGTAWFIFCLFIVRILLYEFIKITTKYKINDFINCIIAFCISLLGIFIGKYIKLPWSIDIALAVLYISYIGYLLKKYSFLKKHVLLILTNIITLVACYFDYKYYGLSINERYYSTPIISINTAIGLSIIIIEFSILLEKIKITYLNLFLKYLGINSLIIMLAHTFANSSKGGIPCTLVRLLISLLFIEVLAIIPSTKKIFSAVSIISIIQEYRNNK